MKKKIALLLLLILAGMWIIASESGWCRMKPGRDPWDPASYSRVHANDSNMNPIHNSCEKNTPGAIADKTSTVNLPIELIESVVRRGDRNSHINKK
ncbi:MAG: hypothetical protein MUP41_14775 [Desulfobacterales bacterium]|nr:hypothetical protein [Desulfobacterales bacterium]